MIGAAVWAWAEHLDEIEAVVRRGMDTNPDHVPTILYFWRAGRIIAKAVHSCDRDLMMNCLIYGSTALGADEVGWAIDSYAKRLTVRKDASPDELERFRREATPEPELQKKAMLGEKVQECMMLGAVRTSDGQCARRDLDYERDPDRKAVWGSTRTDDPSQKHGGIILDTIRLGFKTYGDKVRQDMLRQFPGVDPAELDGMACAVISDRAHALILYFPNDTTCVEFVPVDVEVGADGGV